MAIESLNSSSAAAIQPAQQLTSGSRINQSADDPAGQAVVTALTSQVNQQDVAVQNANNGIGLTQTASGATTSITEQVQRLRELSIQAQNGIYNDQQRQAINAEFQQGLRGIQQIAETTSFNGINLFDGSQSNISIALVEGSSDLTLPDLTTSTLGLDGLNLNNLGNASSAAEQLGLVLDTLSDSQAQFGAQQNGLTSAINQLTETSVNTQAARSQIEDANFAQAVSERTRLQILEYAEVAMQAHRNQSQENVVNLLT